jgi:hypothetical protein
MNKNDLREELKPIWGISLTLELTFVLNFHHAQAYALI